MAKSPATKENARKTPDRKGKEKNLLIGNEKGQGFTKDKQPTPEAKSAGWTRRMGLKEMMSVVPNPKADRKVSAMMNKVAKYFEIPLTEVTVRMMMDYRMQLEAAHNGNVQAYRVVTERVEGRPRIEDGPPPPVTLDEEVIRQKSQIDFGDGITFEV
jgi:hypothetical protein